MNTFYNKEEYDFDDINQLILNHAEESIHLEFKSAEALSKSDGKKKDISKDVAAFANSDGGIIIYGIKEEKHKANEITFIDGNVCTKEWLEQVIQSNIQRNIPDLLIYAIRKNNNINETVYLVKIPFSYDAPHMSSDDRFYKRYNFQAIPMEEYEVRQTYERKKRSKLKIFGCFYGENRNYNLISRGCKGLAIQVIVKNIGQSIEKHFKVEIYFNEIPNGVEIYTPSELKSNDISTDNFRKINIANTCPIFQGETNSAATIFIDIPRQEFLELIEKIKFSVCLMYSSYTEHKEYSLLNLYKEALSIISSSSSATP